MNIYLIPAHGLKQAAGLNRLISLQPGWRHSAPAALFVDKLDNRSGYPLTHKSYYINCDYIYDSNLKVGGKAGGHERHMSKNDTQTIKAKLRLKTTEEGGRWSGIKTGYRPNHVFEHNEKGKIVTTYIGEINFDKEWIQLGDEERVTVTFLLDDSIKDFLTIGRHWWVYEGSKQVGECDIIEV